MKKFAALTVSALLLISFSSAAINSVEEIDYDSNSQFFNGPVFVFDFTADGSTDQINIFTDRSQLTGATSSGEVKSDISINAQNTETKARYDFRDTGDLDINQYTAENFFLEKISSDFSSDSEYRDYLNNELENRCFDINQNGRTDTNDYVVVSGVINGFNIDTEVWCVSAQKKNSVGEISSDPRAVFSTTWQISSGSKKVSTTVSNGQTGDGVSTRVGNDVIINWKGSIGTGKNAPGTGDEKISYSNSQGYRIIDEDAHSQYVNTVENIESELITWKNGGYTGDDIERILNDAANQAQNPHPSTEFTDVTFDGTGFSDGRMDLSIDGLRYPEFTIYANACKTDSGSTCDAFVQIEKSVGVPGDLTVSGDRFNELSSGNVEASFSNVGDAEGRFSARISSCSQGFTFSGVSETVSLNSGQSTTVNLPVTFDSSSYSQKEVSGTCTVEVTETTTDNTITSQASLTGVQQNECNPGNKFVKTIDGQEKVLECTGDGLQTRVVLTCSEDERAEQTSSGYQCVDKESPPVKPECGLNPFCQLSNAWDDTFNRFGSILGTFDILVSAAVTLLSFGWASRNISDFIVGPLSEVTRFTQQQLNIALSGVIALTVGYFAFVVISSIVVKLLLAVGIVAYIYLKSSIGIIGRILLGGSE